MKQLLIIILLSISATAFAQSNTIQVKVGSTGLGIGYQKQFKPKLAGSIALSYLNISPSIFLKGGTIQHRIKGTAKFTQLELAAKWYPSAKATSYGATNRDRFYLKGGLLIRDNGKYNITSDYQKVRNDNQFDNTDPAIGKLNFHLVTNSIQPFLTLGFELINSEKRWCASIDAGLSYHGTSPTVPFVNYYETGIVKRYEPNFNNWVRVPRLIRLVKVYPLLNFTIGRKF
jgi:hypothetical protein